jgi:drug/metabolite transporter (DMT)-like permease
VTSKSKAESALLATTLIWGGTFVVVKIGMQDISPVLLVLVRFAIALLLYLALFRKKLFPVPWSLVLKASFLALFLFIGFVTQNIGLTITTASKSAFITSMMVIFVPVLQFMIERRAPRLGNIVGVGVVTTGLWFLTSPTGSSFNAGDALTLVSAIVFAIYIVYLDVIAHDMTTQQLAFLQTAAMLLYSVVAVVLFETPRFAITTQSILSMVYLTFLGTALTMYVQSRYQKDTTPTRAAIIFSIEPLFASVSAYLILGEELGPLGILGGCLIVGGVLISELSDSIPLLNKSLGPTEP